jgi:aminocarboxymuconate-semialdehyde decarboxylase
MEGDSMKIDIHNHFYPTQFLNELKEVGRTVGISVEKDEWNRTLLVQHGNRLVTLTDPMTKIDQRLKDMTETNIDMQVLTLSIPSVDIFPLEMAVKLARIVNEEIGGICQDHPKHFMALATLPFLSPDQTMKELEYCIEKLGFKGACMGSNINGIGLDNPIFYPFYERMSSYDLPIHMHPRAPIDKETYKDYRLGPIIGFEMDLCVAVVRLVMSGVMEKYPHLNFIVSHLGGAIPYLAERIQNAYEAYPECRKHISKPAKEYLKRFYYDTVSFFEPALMCAYSFLGARKMILGSDYPHVIGDMKRAVSSIEGLPIPQEDKELIYSGNLLKLTHLGH